MKNNKKTTKLDETLKIDESGIREPFPEFKDIKLTDKQRVEIQKRVDELVNKLKDKDKK